MNNEWQYHVVRESVGLYVDCRIAHLLIGASLGPCMELLQKSKS